MGLLVNMMILAIRNLRRKSLDCSSSLRHSSSTQNRVLAARCARVVHQSFAQQRAWGMPGARRTRSLVCKGRKTRVVTTVAPEHPAFPHAMVLTVSFVLSPVIGR